jgi:hypothetical protein
LGALVEAELPSRQDINRVFSAANFSPTLQCTVTQVIAPDWSRFAEKSALRADSFLARLSDQDFEQGMEALRSPGDAINQDNAVTEEIDWFVFRSKP